MIGEAASGYPMSVCISAPLLIIFCRFAVVTGHFSSSSYYLLYYLCRPNDDESRSLQTTQDSENVVQETVKEINERINRETNVLIQLSLGWSGFMISGSDLNKLISNATHNKHSHFLLLILIIPI